MKRTVIALISLLFVAACDETEGTTADRREAKQTAQLADRASQAVGMPGVTNFREKRRVRRLYELRDKALATYTYLRNVMTGELTFLCESVGYGINASIQFSNPQRSLNDKSYTGSDTVLAQPEPNGLFMPEGLAATYVECANPNPKGEPMAVYVEDPIIVSPFPLKASAKYTN